VVVAGTVLGMAAIEFTREELALVHHALSAFLSDFGHKEQDVVHRLQELLGKIPEPSRAEPSRAEPSRAELSRVESS
jgi:hypothetical protein